MFPKVLEGARRSRPVGLTNGLCIPLALANPNICVSKACQFLVSLHVKQQDGVEALHS